MNMRAIDISQLSPEKYENNRENLIKKYEGAKSSLENADSLIATAKEVKDIYTKTLCDDKIATLDVLAFVSIDPTTKDVDNYLFGEISKIIESAVSEEIEEMMEATTTTQFKRQLTPSRLQVSAEIEKDNIFSNDILSEMDDEAVVTIRCMEMYNEICQDATSVSERTRKKMLENQQLLYIISTKLRTPQTNAENNINESVMYTVALVSSVKDGSSPKLSNYKDKIIGLINKGINALPVSQNSKDSINVFSSAQTSLQTCREYLDAADTPSAKNTKITIEAIQEIYKDKVEKISDLYKDELSK